MISNQILQNTIDGLKEIAHIELYVLDVDGKEVASTSGNLDSSVDSARAFVQSPADSQEIKGHQYFKIYDEQQLEYILITSGGGDNSYVIGKMISFQIQSLLVAYKERFDKDNFIKNLLLDNLLLVDIYSRSKKLHIHTDSKRVTMIVESSNGRDNNALEVIRSYSGNPANEFVTEVDEDNAVVVMNVSEYNSPEQITASAQALAVYLEKEGLKDVHVAIGTVVGEIKEVSRSYKEAKMALDVGKIFFNERKVISYSELGIGRLIYQLPIPLCKMFIKEIFDGKNPDEFDEETLTTIDKFFENNLNVSETSRQLFIHRNTLVYRLDKLLKSTGLDLRVFDDAITFKIALMVVKYMNYMEKFEY